MKVSKLTKSLTFSKEAFLVFKTESDSEKFQQSFCQAVHNKGIEKCQQMAELTSSPILKLDPDILCKTGDVSKRLILFTEEDLDHLDSRL